jgi:plastocyanin domain-containing protein
MLAKVLVAAVGAGLIVFINWYFLWSRRTRQG